MDSASEVWEGNAAASGGVDESCGGWRRRGVEFREEVVGDGDWCGEWRKRSGWSETVVDFGL